MPEETITLLVLLGLKILAGLVLIVLAMVRSLIME